MNINIKLVHVLLHAAQVILLFHHTVDPADYLIFQDYVSQLNASCDYNNRRSTQQGLPIVVGPQNPGDGQLWISTAFDQLLSGFRVSIAPIAQLNINMWTSPLFFGS